ncbi:HNH endonuclease [Sphingomonas phyllosphaerae]|uniref:HNH endonuclease n=1 Tax=Sphingomonas phyllosphaerae TaxID=257003 RepID=UPI0003B530C7|nr:HNH endonuclease [Sphingomonas phyllosphaerae]
MIEFIGPKDAWVESTSGERLLFMLLRHHREYAFLVKTLSGSGLRLGGRFSDMSNFFVGASVLHLMQRMVKLAKDVIAEQDGRLDQVRVLRARMFDVLITPLEYGGDMGALVQEVLASAEQSTKELKPGLRDRVAKHGPPDCYSCGRTFGVTPPGETDPLARTADHVWPRALGGDSRFDNLLPACKDCNNAKEHIAAWQMAWLQPAVFTESHGNGGLKGLRRENRMALHMRAAMAYANQNGSTLRDAYLAIGPRIDPARLDDDQGYDFFNLRVHDEARTNVFWTPA